MGLENSAQLESAAESHVIRALVRNGSKIDCPGDGSYPKSSNLYMTQTLADRTRRQVQRARSSPTLTLLEVGVMAMCCGVDESAAEMAVDPLEC